MRVVPEKAERCANKGAAEYRQLSNFRDVLNVEVNGPAGITADVGKHGERAGSNDRAADGKAIQSVGEIDGIRRADDHNADEYKKWNKSQWPEMR